MLSFGFTKAPFFNSYFQSPHKGEASKNKNSKLIRDGEEDGCFQV